MLYYSLLARTMRGSKESGKGSDPRHLKYSSALTFRHASGFSPPTICSHGGSRAP